MKPEKLYSNMTLANKLRALRLKVKASQEEMATLISKHLGVTVPVKTYRHWEYGTRRPRGLELVALEKFIVDFGKSYKETMKISDHLYRHSKKERGLG